MYTTKITYSGRKFCKKQLFLYTLLKQRILGTSFVKNSVAKRIFAELSPETQSATLKFELWEAVHELDTVFCCCKFYCISNQYNLCNALFLQKR